MNTNDPNAGSASRLYRTEHTPRTTGRICCGCTMLFAMGSIPALCLNCSHGTCGACPVIEFVSHSHNLSSHESTHEEPINSSERIPQTLLDPDQAQDMDGQNVPQYEGNQEQEKQVEPYREQPAEQQSSLSGRKKRKLNMTKCQQCRHDKKACIRQDSEKCDRCTEKGLLCSEGTRVIRPRKLPSKSLLPTHDEIPPPIDSDALKISFEQIALLVSYHQMMVEAKARLDKLVKDVGSFIEVAWYRIPNNPAREFGDFVDAIYDQAILLCLTNLLTVKQFPKTVPTRSSLINLILAVDSRRTTDLCYFCSEIKTEIPIDGLRDSVDSCRKFMFSEHLLSDHGCELYEDNPEEEIQIHTMLSTEVLQKIGVVLESLGLSELAKRSRAIGLYHHDVTSWWNDMILRLHTGGPDCLGRTVLHCMLDGCFEYDQSVLYDWHHYERLWDDNSVWNSQDILGRTPLHILCQFEETDVLIESLRKALEIGAHSGLTTIYGTVPLHHAAAKGSARICELLIEHGEEFDIGAQDVRRSTALDYAVINDHKEMVDLLTGRYIEAGLDEKVAKARRIAEAVKEGTYRS